MDSTANILQFCRLCLVKDGVNIPIFDEQGDIRQIYLKISSCLPVKVAREDHLPKKICDGCSNKLDNFYDFWRTSAESEKQLLSWLGATGKDASQVNVKEEENFDEPLASDISKNDDDENKCYMFEQKVEEGPPVEINDEPPPSKRPRRTAAVKAAIAMDQNSDDDGDSGEPITKMEDDSDETDGDDREPAFVDVPSTSADDQPGPSGVSKDGSDAPWTCFGCSETFPNYNDLQLHISGIQWRFQYFCRIHNVHFSDTSLHDCRVKRRCAFCFKYLDDEYQKHPCFHKYTEMDLVFCEFCKRSLTQKLMNKHLKNAHDVKITKLNKLHVRNGGKCRKCNERFSSTREYYQHRYKKHSKRKEKLDVVCYICGKVYSTNTIAEHIKNIHARKRNYKCQECGKCFANKYKLDRHMIVHTNEFKHQCTICNKMFKMVYSLKVHIKMHENKASYECIVCGKSFSTKQSRDNHLRKHTGLEKSKKAIKHLQADEVKVISKKLLDFCNNSRELKRCEVCHTKLHLTESHICTLKERKATNELNHTVVQSEKGNTSINGCTLQYRCSYCKLSFESDSEADRHIEEATCTFLQFCKSCQEFCAGNHEDCKGKQLLFCVSCRVSLKSDKVAQHGCFHTLTKKQQEEDAENIKTDRKFIVDCNLCGRLLPSSFKKTHYIRNHSNKTPRKTLHTCSYCLKTFSNLKDFRKHKRVFHEPFLCHVCGKQIISNEPKSHVDSHENVKRYKCSVCDKSFTFRDCLRKHVVIHSNEAKFICSTCGKHFKRRDNLVVHMRSHAEIKPFPCMLCDKTFTTKQWRDSHIKTHTMEELMKMERRPQTFRRKEMSDV
nr:unnamed protein product [Callosobruchus analis]